MSKTIMQIIKQAFDSVADSINETLRQITHSQFGEIDRVHQEMTCVDTLLRNPRLRAVETDEARAVLLRSGNVQVYSEGDNPRAYTIGADRVQDARKEAVKR